MTPPRHIAVIDIGKTNAKVVLVDAGTFSTVGKRSRPNTVLSGPPYPHYDVDGLWTFILTALGELNREHEIDAITVTAHGASCALLDASGELAMPVLDYEHDGPDSLAAEYNAVRPSFAETGSPRLPGGLNLGAQIYWQQQRFPDAFATVRAILTYPQFWTFRLSGTPATEVTSLGTHTDLWNPAAGDFSSLVERLGWRKLFPSRRTASDGLGPIRPEVAVRTGLRPDVRVYCGIHDSNASLLPHLLSRPRPFAVVATGTWVVAMAIGGQPGTLDPQRDTLINVDAFGKPVPSARFMGGREHAIVMQSSRGIATAADIEAVLSRRPLLLPSIQAGSGPFPNRRSEWRTQAHITPGEQQAALSFYLALMTATCLDLIGADGPIIVEGPFAADECYVRMLAAATGRTILLNIHGGTGTHIGAALLAALGTPGAAAAERVVINRVAEWQAYAAHWRSVMQ